MYHVLSLLVLLSKGRTKNIFKIAGKFDGIIKNFETWMTKLKTYILRLKTILILRFKRME